MDTAALVSALSKAGVTGPAMPDALARAQAHFGDQEPGAEQLEAWGKQLQAEAPHLFPAPQPDVSADVRLSAEEKLTRGRPAGPLKYRALTITDKAQQAELDTITSPVAKLTRYREMLAQQAQR